MPPRNFLRLGGKAFLSLGPNVPPKIPVCDSKGVGVVGFKKEDVK